MKIYWTIFMMLIFEVFLILITRYIMNNQIKKQSNIFNLRIKQNLIKFKEMKPLKLSFIDWHNLWIFWISIFISILIVLIFIDYKKLLIFFIGNNNPLNIEQLNPIVTLILIYFELILWSLLIIIIRNKNKIKNIQKDENWNSINLLSSIFDEKNHYILGDSGFGKSTRVIKTLLKNNEIFFYYDCTYDNFLSKAIINNGKVEKIIFWAVKKLILKIYKNIIIDDIHLLKSNELFQVSEWLEFYNQRLFIISPKNFRFNNEYNHTDYYNVSNIIDKLYSKFTLIDYEVRRYRNSYISGLEQFLEKMFGNEFKVSFRVETTLRTKTNSNMYHEFYNEIKLVLESLKKEHKQKYQDIVNVQLIRFFGGNESNLKKQLEYMNQEKLNVDSENKLDNDILILIFIYIGKMTENNISDMHQAYGYLSYYILYWNNNENVSLLNNKNVSYNKEEKKVIKSIEHIMKSYKQVRLDEEIQL